MNPGDEETSDDPGAVYGGDAAAQHVPVLMTHVLELLAPSAGKVMFDCTIGRGGHAAAILPRLAPGGRYIGLDVDAGNLAFVKQRLADPPVQLDLVHANFGGAAQVLRDMGVGGVDLLLADIGFASTQVDDPARGFSFMNDGPLDMRLDLAEQTTAADIVNGWPEKELADAIYEFGEERLSRVIARKIVENRRREPIKTTKRLAEICGDAYGPRRYSSHIDPATRTFQALRIVVNDELGSLGRLLEALPAVMRPGGHAAIIAFHSLEDRMVKQAFRKLAGEGRAELLTRKPRIADEIEQQVNRRSRSAKLRAIRWTAGSLSTENR